MSGSYPPPDTPGKLARGPKAFPISCAVREALAPAVRARYKAVRARFLVGEQLTQIFSDVDRTEQLRF